MEPLTVIVAVDGSDMANEAFAWYTTNFHKPGNKVYLLYSPETYVNIQRFEMSPARAMDLQKEADEKTKSVRQKYSDMAKALDVKIAFEEAPDLNPGVAIEKFASKINASFIVMGTRGMGTIKRTILGSVSDHVLHHAHCPVLICRPQKRPQKK